MKSKPNQTALLDSADGDRGQAGAATSRASGLRAAGVANLQERVAAKFRAAGETGLTDEQLADTFVRGGDPHKESTLRARRVELVKASQVIDSGQRRETRSSVAAVVWCWAGCLQDTSRADGGDGRATVANVAPEFAGVAGTGPSPGKTAVGAAAAGDGGFGATSARPAATDHSGVPSPPRVSSIPRPCCVMSTTRYAAAWPCPACGSPYRRATPAGEAPPPLPLCHGCGAPVPPPTSNPPTHPRAA